MASVTNLTIGLQSGTTNTHYASWEFSSKVDTTVTNTNVVKVGSLVSINSGATYYNGAHIPNWVATQNWYIKALKNDRAVLGQNEAKDHDITSPINVKDITVVDSSGSTTGSTTVDVSTLDHYEVTWHYDSGDGVWFSGGTSTTEETNATYSTPSNAIKVRVTVTPVAKTHKVNDTETPYWTGTAVSAEYSISIDPPSTPSSPTVKIENFTLTATLDNISDGRADEIEFQIYDDTEFFNSGRVTVKACKASYTCSINAGGKYRVRCRSVNTCSTTDVYSEWSSFTTEETTIPTASSGITICRANSETSVYLEWGAVSNATSYEIEYTTEKNYFDNSDETSIKSGIEFNHFEVTGLASGDEYFFRVRAVNEKGKSSWSDIVSVIIGSTPSAPTTWSSTTTVIVGDPLTLYWVHNSEDGSAQTYADVEMYVNGVKETHTIRTVDEQDDEKTMYYVVDTSKYTEGVKILWRVRTAGVTNTYGDWSIQRTVDVYAPPTLVLRVTDSTGATFDTLTSFPFYISGTPGPATQIPLGYHVAVTSNKTYTTINNMGNAQTINKGETVYSKYFDTHENLLIEMSAGNIDLENGVSYTITCTVSMNSGLTAEASKVFTVSWSDVSYEPDAQIGIDRNTLCAYINPYCLDSAGALVSDVKLSVYRREFDGGFTEIGTGIDNTMNTYVTDPHPALDFARYRIVAISTTTGAVSFYDAPGYPVGEKAVVIQWNEAWRSFDSTSESSLEQPPWSGSLLKLPYNIDVSDRRGLDVSLVEYIGRKHPVSYYGTQLGETASWNMEIVKSDKDTLYALRRLSVWMGDVYVREPSGSGYWASISVSFSQKHCKLTIPVTLDITRVVGGA